MCLLAYFAEADDCSDTQYVTFSRVSAKSLPDWSKCEKPVARERTIVHDGLMEAVMLSSDRPAFVDFANKNLHIHQVIPSCTQEEILFSCAPSCFVSMLITGRCCFPCLAFLTSHSTQRRDIVAERSCRDS